MNSSAWKKEKTKKHKIKVKKRNAFEVVNKK